MTDSTQEFYVKNCALAAIATGERANSLLELRDKLAIVDESCIYFHFWGARMKSQFVQSHQHNDFAIWAHDRLHDHILAEKLSIIDPTEFENLEALRQELIEKIEERLENYEIILCTQKTDRFHFIRSTIIVFENSTTIKHPKELAKAIAKLPPSSIFYHFIDARTRTPDKIDDFSGWLKMFGNTYEPLIVSIQAIDPYFLSLTQLREELTTTIERYFENEGKDG